MIKKILILFLSLFLIIMGYGRFIEPNRIQITTYDFQNKYSSSALAGKKIVQLSDLHFYKHNKNQTTLLEKIESINPDLIVLTGDYIGWDIHPEPAINFMSKLKARYGVYAVMGDYDYSNSRHSCLFCHEKGTGNPTQQHQVKMLRNSFTKIVIDGKDLFIAGIDEGYEDKGGVNVLKDEIIGAHVTLMLSHSPLLFDRLGGTENVFMVAGDTHGGQVKLPKLLFKLFGYEKNVIYNYGLFEKGKNKMIVNRGIGTSHLKFRLFVPPEIVVIQF